MKEHDETKHLMGQVSLDKDMSFAAAVKEIRPMYKYKSFEVVHIGDTDSAMYLLGNGFTLDEYNGDKTHVIFQLKQADFDEFITTAGKNMINMSNTVTREKIDARSRRLAKSREKGEYKPKTRGAAMSQICFPKDTQVEEINDTIKDFRTKYPTFNFIAMGDAESLKADKMEMVVNDINKDMIHVVFELGESDIEAFKNSENPINGYETTPKKQKPKLSIVK